MVIRLVALIFAGLILHFNTTFLYSIIMQYNEEATRPGIVPVIASVSTVITLFLYIYGLLMSVPQVMKHWLKLSSILFAALVAIVAWDLLNGAGTEFIAQWAVALILCFIIIFVMNKTYEKVQRIEKVCSRKTFRIALMEFWGQCTYPFKALFKKNRQEVAQDEVNGEQVHEQAHGQLEEQQADDQGEESEYMETDNESVIDEGTPRGAPPQNFGGGDF